MVLLFGFIFPVHKSAERIKNDKETNHVEKNMIYQEPKPDNKHEK